MVSLDGAVAFISGVARGQGRSHALRLAAEGTRIVGFDLCAQIDAAPFPMSTEADLAETERLVRAAGGDIVTRLGDVRDQGQVDAALAAGLEVFGRVDIVLANAGISHPYRRTWELTEEDFRETVDVNLVGVWRTIKAAVPAMIEQGDGGSIVVTGSGASTTGLPNLAGYVAAKHGLVGLVRTLTKELGPHGIRINAVLPGNTWTPMFDNDGIRRLYVPGQQEVDEDVFTARAAAMSPMRVPWVEASDVSETVAWLVSPAARYISGALLPVDAGSASP
jgi:SDR family mycofactocin-dependent oxidoreductase